MPRLLGGLVRRERERVDLVGTVVIISRKRAHFTCLPATMEHILTPVGSCAEALVL